MIAALSATAAAAVTTLFIRSLSWKGGGSLRPRAKPFARTYRSMRSLSEFGCEKEKPGIARDAGLSWLMPG
jgi:hypothetical protein